MLRERNIGGGVGERRKGCSVEQGAVSQSLREQRGLGRVPTVSGAQFSAAHRAVEAKEEETETGS